jgi:flagellar biosynthesis chaperone FliJ
MTENEAKIFIQNAMEQSKNVLAELMLIMPKVFAVRKKSLGEYYSNLENCKKEIQSCEVAIKALEEVQRWHTSVINPNIKNEFANTSTQICHNCDHKDEYIEELEAEVENGFSDGEAVIAGAGDSSEALSDWRQYRKVGTLEECRAAVEKQTAKRPRIMGNAMICPSCPRCFKSDNSAYCPSCGQKLKWEDEE